MKNLVLTALLFGTALQATGCIIVDDDDDDIDPPPANDRGRHNTRLDATWRLLSGDDAATCRPGANSAAALYSCPGEAANCVNPARQPFADIGECLSGQSTATISVPLAGDPTLALPPGRYTTWVEFSSDGSVYAKSFTETIDVAAGRTATVSFDVQVDHGFVDAAWVLTRGSETVACNEVAGLDGIGINVAPCVDSACAQVADRPIESEFDCPPGEGRTNPIPFNGDLPYSVVVDAFNANRGGLGAAAPQLVEPFPHGNYAEFLGTVMIDLD